MSKNILLTTRVVQAPDLSQDKPKGAIMLFHSDSDSALLLEVEFDQKQVGKWGTTPRVVRGHPYSLMGQFVGELIIDGEVPLTEKNMAAAGEYNEARLSALSNALSFLLNEFFQGQDGRDGFITPDELVDVIDNQVFVLGFDNAIPGQVQLLLLPVGMTIRELTIAMADISPVFNREVPRHLVDGLNQDGVVSDLKGYLKAQADEDKVKSKAH